MVIEQGSVVKKFLLLHFYRMICGSGKAIKGGLLLYLGLYNSKMHLILSSQLSGDIDLSDIPLVRGSNVSIIHFLVTIETCFSGT